jgi:hypothetical protein
MDLSCLTQLQTMEKAHKTLFSQHALVLLMPDQTDF